MMRCQSSGLSSYLWKRRLHQCLPLTEKKQRKPNGYWTDPDNQRYFLEDLAAKKGLSVPHQLGKLSFTTIRENGGKEILRKHPNTLEMLHTLYPEQKWEQIDLSSTPRGYWQSIHNQKLFFTQIMKRYKLTEPTELAGVPIKLIKANGGRVIIDKHSSYSNALRAIFPNEDWDVAISRKKRGYWGELANVKEFIKLFEEKYQIDSPSDWYRISQQQFTESGGHRLIHKYGSILEILRVVYPTTPWNKRKIRKRDKRSAQWWLYRQITTLYPNLEVIEEYVHAELTRLSGQVVELDIFIPQYNIAFEYHGIHHYKDTAIFGPVELYAERDKEKQALCNSCSLTLVVIPYWWDNTTESLLRDYLSLTELPKQIEKE